MSVLEAMAKASALSLSETGKPVAVHYVSEPDLKSLAVELRDQEQLSPMIMRQLATDLNCQYIQRLVLSGGLTLRGVPVRRANFILSGE